MLHWTRAFQTEIGKPANDIELRVESGLAAGQLWLWEDREPVLSKQLRDAGYRCSLYTDLGNPTSNSIYRRIGYRAVSEILRYRFE